MKTYRITCAAEVSANIPKRRHGAFLSKLIELMHAEPDPQVRRSLRHLGMQVTFGQQCTLRSPTRGGFVPVALEFQDPAG